MTFDVQLYFSGSVEEPVNRYILEHPGTYRLATFAYPKEAYDYLNLADDMGVRTNMLIDSGAFTSWSVGKPVQLNDLVAYHDDLLQNYGDRHNFVFISLDVIPGERGRRPTASELQAGIDKSKDNYNTLQQHHRNHYVLPVYHTGEDYGLRNYYMERTDYLCLSMDQGMSERDRLEWAKRAAHPGWKYHGLAATGNRMVTEVPWYSVDSSSWITVAAMGGLLWPTPDGRFRVLSISEDSPNRHDRGAHLKTVSAYERQQIEKVIQSYGFDPEELATHYTPRRKWNVTMWLNTPWRRNIKPATDLFEGLA